MKKKFFTFCGLISFIGLTYNVNAENLVFKMLEDSGIEIVNNGRFDASNQCLGYTQPGSTICLGEIDFGNRDKYFACSIEIAHENANMEGFADFYFGHPDEGGLMFNDIAVKGTGAFQYYRTYQYNFYPEDEKVPAGKGKVYMRYRECEGNIKTITFYSQPIPDDDQGMVKDPVYTYKSLKASIAEIIKPDESEARLNDAGAIGWAGNGVMAKFIGVDFKNVSTYQQVAVVSSYGGTSLTTFLKLYIDNPDSEDNLIANIWTGRDFGWNVYAPLADNLKEGISGIHDLYVVWTGATNLKEVQLIEGKPWNVEEPVKPAELIDEKLSGNEYGMFFDGMGGYPNSTEILAPGASEARYQSDNLGYTSYGVVVKFNQVDFKTGQFKRILVNHSSDQATLKNSSFDFYLDLPFTAEDFEDLSILDDQQMLASVGAQGTSDWGKAMKTAGAMLSTVSGVHDLYMVLKLANGANVFAVYIDTELGGSSIPYNTLPMELNVSIQNEEITIISENTVLQSIKLYSIDGKLVADKAVAGNKASLKAGKGLYILKMIDNTGNVQTKKIIVK